MPESGDAGEDHRCTRTARPVWRESGLPIQFKGGSSLLLRLKPIRRLSIDVDIVTQAKPEELVAVLERVSKLAPLTGHEHDAQRDKELPPKKHFRVFYPSVVERKTERKTDHVLLDVLFERQVAPHCKPVIISTSFITPEREVLVSVPTVNSLLGDKLTAFAPRTIGILYNPLRKTDIAKQLFDVGALFDAATDLSVAAEAYAAAHARQLVYRKATFSLADTLNDSIEAGFLYSQLELRGGAKTEQGLFLQDGVTGLQNHLVNQPVSPGRSSHSRRQSCLRRRVDSAPPGRSNHRAIALPSRPRHRVTRLAISSTVEAVDQAQGRQCTGVSLLVSGTAHSEWMTTNYKQDLMPLDEPPQRHD